MPCSLLLNSALFTSKKNHVTLKGLVGISLSGTITFVSQPAFHQEDIRWGNCPAKWYIVPCIWQWRCSNGRQRFPNSRHFTSGRQFKNPTLSWRQQSNDSRGCGQNSTNCQNKHSCGYNRFINKIKNFRIWELYLLGLFLVVNQMWTVCTFLCNTQDLLI